LRFVTNMHLTLGFILLVAIVITFIVEWQSQIDTDHRQEKEMSALSMNEIPKEAEEQLDLLASEHGDYRNAVEWFKQQGSTHVQLLIRSFNSKEAVYLQQVHIIETLGEIDADTAVPFLGEVLRSGELTWEAAQALGKIGDEQAEDELIKGLNSNRGELVKESAKALGYVNSNKSFTALKAEINNSDAAVRFHVIQSIILQDKADLLDILNSRLDIEDDADVRKLIEDSLKHIGALKVKGD